MSSTMPEIDVSAATAALNDGGGVESMMAAEAHREATGAPAPVQQTQTETAAPTQTDATTVDGGQQAEPVPSGIMRDPVTGRWVSVAAHQAAQQAQQQTAESTDSNFTSVDPNTLAPELQHIYKSLQADYTRKTQEIAEQRRTFEQLGGLDTVTEAVNVYNQLQNPESWPALHAELSQGLQALGFSVQDANEAATQAVAEHAAGQQSTVQDPFAALGDDEELAPVKDAYQQMAHQLNELKSQYEADRQRQQQEQMQLALIGEMQRQENIIRTANKHYTDEDVKAVYELASYHGGNLLTAQQRYEAIINDRLARFMNEKQGVAETVTVLPGTATQQSAPAAQRPRTIEEGHAMALEALRAIDAAA